MLYGTLPTDYPSSVNALRPSLVVFLPKTTLLMTTAAKEKMRNAVTGRRT